MRIALSATLVIALVACGSNPGGTIDAGDGNGGDGDAGTDVMIDADPNVRGTVTVTIVDKNDAPLPGMYVVFIDTDATVTERMTDSNGQAEASVYPNASVTAVRNRGMSYALVTVQALNPGDQIKLISAASNVPSSEDAFSQRVLAMPGADIVASPNGASKAGTTATFSTIAPHGLVAGDRVVVSGITGVPAYNGNWTVTGAPTATTFTVTIGGGGLANSGSPAVGATAMKAVAFTVNYSANAGTNHYEVHTRCGTFDVGNVTSAPLALPVGCVVTPMDITVLAKTSGGVTLAWTQQPSVTIATGGTMTIGDTWHAPSQLVATYTNPTAEVTDLSVARFSPYVRGFVDAETTSAATATTNVMMDVPKPARGVISTQLMCPSGASSSCISTPMGSAAQRITNVVDGASGVFALDIGATVLPWVKAQYVPATTTLDITVVGNGAFDIFEGNLRYTRGQNIYTWRVFGPLAQAVKFPTLPATAPGDPTILTSDTMSSYQAFIGESDAVSGYRDAIKSPFEALGACEASANVMVRPYAGTRSRISQWN